MAAKFFGQFLLERGLISREALLGALEYQKGINLPLGALAIEKKCLTTEQVKSIHAEQKRTDKKFGEIAVEKNLLTKSQLDDLLSTQTDRWVFLGEALVQKEYLTHEQLEQQLKEYRKAQEKDEVLVATDLQAVPQQEVVESFLDITLKMFLRVAREVVKIVQVKINPEEELKFDYLFTQSIGGDKTFTFGLTLPEPLILAIPSQMIQKEQIEMNEFVLDAVKEFLNLVVGNGCAKLSIKEYQVEPLPPKLLKKGDALPVADECVWVEMTSTKGDFKALFFFS